MALEIYNELIEEDLTKGYTIAGTGTLDINGDVGSISGIKYKLKSAEKENPPESNFLWQNKARVFVDKIRILRKMVTVVRNSVYRIALIFRFDSDFSYLRISFYFIYLRRFISVFVENQ